jgi:probable phosphoglycerate mutase
MARLFLVRHGESGWNRAHRVQGQSPAAPGLTRKGLAQAAVVAAQLDRSGATLVLTSDLPRAVQTARPIAGRLGAPLRIEPRLRERSLGAAEGRDSDEVGPAELGFDGERVIDPDAAPPGGESLRQLYDRVTRLLCGLLEESQDRRIVLVSHGGPVRVTQAWLAGLGPAQMSWPPVLNCAVLPVLPSRKAVLPSRKAVLPSGKPMLPPVQPVLSYGEQPSVASCETAENHS